MRSRSTIILVLFALVAALPIATANAAQIQLAQPEEEADPGDDPQKGVIGEEEELPRQEEGQGEEGEGQGDPDAETGAGQGEQEEGEATEAGEPWTYQMSWMAGILFVLVLLGIGASYYRLVVQRTRTGI